MPLIWKTAQVSIFLLRKKENEIFLVTPAYFKKNH
jgi:hypothetical protein